MNIKARFRKWMHREGGSVFSRTQTRLTLQYSGLLMLFLILFIVIVLGLLYYILINDSKRQINALADEEIAAVRDILIHSDNKKPANQVSPVYFTIGQNQFFYYWIDASGTLKFGEELQGEARGELLRWLSGWRPSSDKVRIADLYSRDRDRDFGERFHPEQEQKLKLMAAGRSLYMKNQLIGTLYIGRDVSFQFKLFRWSLAALLALGLLFFLLALYLSHIMSRRAMIPIAHSYTRQREFVADASHELRTPLSVILSSIDTLQMEETLGKDAFIQRVLGNMKGEVKRMTKLAGDLLTLARSDSGTLLLQSEPLDLTVHAQEMLLSLQPLAQAKQIDLQLKAPQTLPIRGDADRLEQLLVLLVDNAIKYTPDGGYVLVALSVETVKAASELKIIVQDTGIGIPPEEHQRIFARFYRRDKSRSRQLGGHGLGLAIAKWIVDAHQGSIQVVSKVGEGSTFTVRIPFERQTNNGQQK
ncbi:sensor histidine kinase [Paenibacillus solisilvae]|uniref:histidine kinase n=1 Tax=Paenibacillus solisilvae TaxID=2486751 RepID=A0ABW0VXT6_9BACL